MREAVLVSCLSNDCEKFRLPGVERLIEAKVCNRRRCGICVDKVCHQPMILCACLRSTSEGFCTS